MSGLKDTINAHLKGAGSDVKKTNTPQDWRARLEVDEQGGYFISTPRNAGDIEDAADLFNDFNLDPRQWEVISVRKSRWQNHAGEWLEAARVSIKPAEQLKEGRDADYDALVSYVERWKPTKVEKHTGELYAIYAIGDTQYGKDAGGGTEIGRAHV